MKNRRRMYLIDKRYQVRFSLVMLVLVVVSQLVFIWYGSAITRYSLNKNLPGDHAVKVWKSIKGQLWEDHRSKLILLLAVDIMLATFAGLVISHQMAGPSLSITQKLKQFKDGDLSVSFSVRKGDSMKNIAAGLNATVHIYRNRIRELKRLMEIAQKDDEAPTPEGQDALREVIRILENMKTS